jgi:hypothetical protein
MCVKNFNVKAKGYFCNSGKFRSFDAKWVRMVGKSKYVKGYFARSRYLLLNLGEK